MRAYADLDSALIGRDVAEARYASLCAGLMRTEHEGVLRDAARGGLWPNRCRRRGRRGQAKAQTAAEDACGHHQEQILAHRDVSFVGDGVAACRRCVRNTHAKG